MIQTPKLLTNILLGIITLVIIVSCSQLNQEQLTTSDSQSQFKVASILPGSIKKDDSWSQASYEGLKLIEKQYNAEINYTENVPDTDVEASIRRYAQQGYNLIIGHSGGYIEAMEKVAQEFPDIKFALVTSYSGNNKNLGAVAFRSGEVGYLAGALAAIKTKTNKVGYMVGYDYSVYQEEAELFRRGATATKPDIEVYTKFLQTWTDAEKGNKVALDWLEKGVDIMAINANEAGISALKLASEKPEVYGIGWTKDQYNLVPGKILTSVLQNIPELVLKIATLVQQGRWEGKQYKYGLREQIYDFAPFRGTLTAEEEAKFNQIKQQVITGKIDITPSGSTTDYNKSK
ncbi:BMP family protein [Planktothrix agardhii]|uniref:BMP family protein n=1 Tax=Planktothrix agardhii TaxID=1160 RepID=UPI000424D0E9|nr:BMP family protein [Planktothrix agardhii]CAD0226645.1 Basic membrane lipoprotein [Planktothrix agardhii]CAD5951373.1 Transcriptional activator protein med [Planktothrix agardhii]